ncbi:hypothetical protein EF919_18170 [Streptomyces sp. WAC02707]|uniref:hypothetical protein n=1 Tax=Streptomyces sp. WAC02707 TaxID=2487417 RepID=UPI000F79ACE6|nr:hypothetical protein [Streptomyces sp. WAC02707]RSS92460.1 hypothetical protein EF919_18170 [Streptomyces sp. WAC02707]
MANDEQPEPDEYEYLERPRDGNGKYLRSMDNVRRDAEAAAYWAEHRCTYQEIADRFGYYDRSQAWRGIQSAKRDVALPAVTKLRQTEAEQLDALYLMALEIIERNHVVVSHGRVVCGDDGQPLQDDGPRLQAIQTALRIRDQYQALHGLKQPAKVEHSGGVKFEIVGVDPQDLV